MGSGKSTIGNTMVGKPVFRVGDDLNSVTQVTQPAEFEYNGQEYLYADTPGLFDPNVDQNLILKELKKIPDIIPGGVHVFLFCVNLAQRFRKEDYETFQAVRNEFPGSEPHVLFAFTHMGDRTQSQMQQRVEEGKVANNAFRSMMDVVGDAYVFFRDPLVPEHDRMSAFDRILKLVNSLGGQPYSNENIREAARWQRTVAKRMEGLSSDVARQEVQRLLDDVQSGRTNRGHVENRIRDLEKHQNEQLEAERVAEERRVFREREHQWEQQRLRDEAEMQRQRYERELESHRQTGFAAISALAFIALLVGFVLGGSIMYAAIQGPIAKLA
eukprot:TRINITY_DN21696_c0_g1_i1.p1 TRINITY_DN21696_c0_g1~~TRINITY_DN21696_c0_g1_i1.p1  ORF type:complete len:384 (-),score=61.07 TRINITY_DN21696_c0_g1_i1:8-991(-)